MPNMELVLALLAATSLLAGLARYLRIPYPVVLVIGGAALAAIPGVPTVRIPPDVVFLVFLPPLLYAAGADSSPAELRDSAGPILILAVGLVLATVAAVAAVAHAAIGLAWPEGFALGAILGATDPLAATAIIRRLGAPQRIAILLEGEALINDGTALTAFKVALAAMAARSFSLGHGAASFLVVSAGGAAIGVAVGAVSVTIRRRLEDPNVEIAIALLTAYAAYIAADRAGTSGVLAAVAAGLLTARSSASVFSPGARLRSNAFWQVASFILNALLFLLVGLQLRAVLDGIAGADAGTLAWQSASVVGVVVVLRIAWMYALPLGMRALARHLPGKVARRSPREQLVLGWSGMRGAVSLAAALSLPYATPHGSFASARGTIVFVAFVAIFATLVIPGLTLAPLIRRLGLGQSERLRRQSTHARLRVLRAGMMQLDELAEGGELSEPAVARLRDRYEARMTELEQQLGEQATHGELDELRRERRARERLLDAQRGALRRLAAERAAPAEVLREIERDLDLESTRLAGS